MFAPLAVKVELVAAGTTVVENSVQEEKEVVWPLSEG